MLPGELARLAPPCPNCHVRGQGPRGRSNRHTPSLDSLRTTSYSGHMPWRSQILYATAGAFCAGAAMVWSAQAQSQPTWRHAVIELIEAERVLVGEVCEHGDCYLVKRRAGRLRIAKAEVFRVCDSLEALYELKRKEIEPRDPDEHVRMAQWCRRYELREQAKRELEAALRLEPRHRQAQIMYDSMAYLSQPRKAQTTAPGADKKSPQPTGREKTSPLKYSRWLALQRRETTERFAGRVQMLLLNHCGSGRCHGGDHKGLLRLVRTPSGVLRSQSTTQKNLRAVFRNIRADDLEASPILVKPLLPRGAAPPSHGGGRIFSGADDRGFLILKKWVSSLRTPSRTPKTKRKTTRRADGGAGKSGLRRKKR